MADDGKPKTELLDELEKGPWPSFVKEIKQAAEANPVCQDLLGQLELSYEEKKGHWKHGGIVGVLGYGGGVIGRYSDIPDQFPAVAHVRGADRKRLRSGRLRVRHAHALLLRGSSPLRMGLLRHTEALL
jgi:hypothetical protein